MSGDEVEHPEDPLVEQSIQRGTGDPYRKRVTLSGDVLEQSSVQAGFDGEEWHFDSQPLAWRRIAELSVAQLDEIHAAIAESGFMDVAPEHRPHGTSIGGSDVTWTATLDGRTHTVTLFGVPDVQVPEVNTLAGVVERTIALAQNRAARGS